MRGLVVALAALTACGGTSEKDCPADEPATCPASGPPSYATDIAPIFATYCTATCHEPGGVAADRLLSTYAEVKKVGASDINTQVYDCLMPMPPAPDLSIAERVTLLTWIVCGSPDN
jgi:hypothetical protein|nr:hypothetical protein [Kofleriaceae bacterium]